MGKSYKTSKHTNKLHLLQKYAIKIKILKLSLNIKKNGQFCLLDVDSLKKILNSNRDADRTWGGSICRRRLIYEKIEKGVMLFVAKLMEEKEKTMEESGVTCHVMN
jgi:hypothetical protein